MEACCFRFTAAEGGARLAAATTHSNILAVEYASFIATRLVHEDAYKIRGSLYDGRQRTIYVTRASRVPCVTYELKILTDLSVAQAIKYHDVYDWYPELDKNEVLVCTSPVIRQILEDDILTMDKINVLILDSCHLICKDHNLQYVMKLYKECEEKKRPRILGLTYPLFTLTKKDNNVSKEKDPTKNTKNEHLNETEVFSQNGEVLNENNILKAADEGIEKDTTLTENDNIIETKNTEINDTELKEIDSIDKSVNDKEDLKVSIDSEAGSNDAAEVIIDDKNKDLKEIGVNLNMDDFNVYEKLEWKIEDLEKELCCQMDLAEDIDGGKRLSGTINKPKELIIEYNASRTLTLITEDYVQLDQYMRDTVNNVMGFLNDHRYDPTEIYGDDMYEEFMNIPNPTIDPKMMFKQFLYILDELGPYAADKAAFSLLIKLEKLKIKVPYERHFLLLRLCTSVFVKIRCYADLTFSKYASDWEKIQLFCTPKVHRFAEILEKFKPPNSSNNLLKPAVFKSVNSGTKNEKLNETIANMDATNNGYSKNTDDSEIICNNSEKTCDGSVSEGKDDMSNTNTHSKTEEMLKEIDDCDFTTLGNKIEDKVNTYVANLKDLDYEAIEIENKDIENCDSVKETDHNKVESDINNVEEDGNKFEVDSNKNGKLSDKPLVNSPQKGILGFTRRTGHRTRGRGRVLRNNAARVQQMQQNPDALCGVVFMKEELMAKIMFLLIVDMSRSNPELSYICAQYCALEQPAALTNELQECQRQGKKQEDVLKKFRMHECNLLLATSALEEGIDLPRCNLVLRWDVPPSYRSYGLCRGRARAPRAASVLLSRVHADTDVLLHNVAIYTELDQIITRKCGCGIQDEPPQSEEDQADVATNIIKPYTPNEINNAVCEIKTCDRNKKNNKSDGTKNKTDESGNESIVSNLSSDIIGEHCNNINDKILNYDIKKVPNAIEANIDSVQQKFCDINNVSDEKEKIVEDNNSQTKNNNLICNKCNRERCNTSIQCDCCKKVNSTLSDNKICDRDSRKCDDEGLASVDLSTAIALINRYCGKLPSDTFTRLAPQWWMEQVQLPARGGGVRPAYICTLRLPLNCPVKYNIVGHPMPTKVLAKRMVALQACRILHKSGELDNQLMPIGKENFKAAELEASNAVGQNTLVSGEVMDPNDLARPGTTKRRQYYFKRTAWAFTDCQPVIDTSDSEIDTPERTDNQTDSNDDAGISGIDRDNTEDGATKKGVKRNMLYSIVSSLWCALPERYNTRGRRLHAPQHAAQAIGVLMARHEPDRLQIPSFPVYTRSGEVRVSVELVPDADVRVSPKRDRRVRRFMRFVFAEVLRVRRRGMKLQNEGSTHNNYYIVPTIKTKRADGTIKVDVDWAFLELIYQHTEEMKTSDIEKPLLWNQEQYDDDEDDAALDNGASEKEKQDKEKMENPLLKPGETFEFDAEKYREAVVTPWYRNQDQPQFFLVAEICGNLTPDSAFPSATHTSFRNYYSSKYGVELTQSNQPLLDVDHTSARLNLLTPRYVNRKGVALPVSSERTRRAKRDRLDQKQILVPELCRVHPFAAPLWFATVALPCVLYRINALLIADEIRRAVAIDVGLGIPKIDGNTCPGFQWPPLDFGWSLAEVLSADSEKNEKNKENSENKTEGEVKELDCEDSKREQPDSKEDKEEQREKTINEILQEKEEAESGFEIGMWSNEMASSIPESEEYNEYLEPLPPNLTFCTSASGGSNWCDPIQKPKSQFYPPRAYSVADSNCSYLSSDFDTDDSDFNTDASDDEDTDLSGFCSSKNSNAAMGVRIEYKTAHEAEAVDVERKKRVNPAPQPDEEDDELDRRDHDEFIRAGDAPEQYLQKFRQSVEKHKKEIVERGSLIPEYAKIADILPEMNRDTEKSNKIDKVAEQLSNTNIKNTEQIDEIFPYASKDGLTMHVEGQITLENIEKNKRFLLAELTNTLSKEEIKKLNCFSMVDVDIDSPSYVNEKIVNVGFDTKSNYEEKLNKWGNSTESRPYYKDCKGQNGKEFDFDQQPRLEGHPGPSPSVILQALTMSNANDGINLERLETIGDSFLKFAITAYLYCAHPTVHEGKLSHMRSKQVSNLNLYRLGRNKRLGARMIASKFEPHDNWLPPCHRPPPTLHPRKPGDTSQEANVHKSNDPHEGPGCFIPYNLITQHSIPDKSIADCVEALIGAYLLECGPRGALLFMSWLGIRVLPKHLVSLPSDHPYVVAASRVKDTQKPALSPTLKTCQQNSYDSESDCSTEEEEDQPWQQHEDWLPEADWSWCGRPVGSLRPYRDDSGNWLQPVFGELKAPPSPLLRYIADPEGELEQMLSGYDALERTLQYRFKDRSLLLQALTHASHQKNRLTDCYQRLEFLGDAILDYLITRHLYEDPRRHSPGALTDLRSALVNNTIFATLAARHGFHKYFRHMSPGLNEVLTKYVKIQEENGHSISEEHYLIQEDEMEQAEDVEVPKALGDLFESVAGAIFLDSGMSLGAVWKSYVNLMGAELEAFSAAAPKSPVRELLEAEPDTAKFGKPERLADGRRVRVCVEVFGRGSFKGVGRNYRIAKGTAARCALRHLRMHKPR